MPSKDKNSVTGHVVFKDPVTAAKVLHDLKGAKLESRELELIPGVVKNRLAFRAKGYLQLSMALAPSKSKAILTFSTKPDSNSLLANPLFSRRAKRIKPKKENGQEPKVFKVYVKLADYEDEFMLREQIRAARLALPLHISIARADIAPDLVEELKVLINELEDMLPDYVHQCIVHKVVFFDEKTKRGGVNCYFNSFEDIERAANDKVVFDNLKLKPPRFNQLIRIEKFFSASIAINATVWKMFEDELHLAIRAHRSTVMAVVNQKQHLVVVDLHSQTPAKLDELRRNIDNVIKCTVYTHPQKNFIFSSIGRKRLGELNLAVQWDRAGTIRIYGRDDERAKAKEKLDELMEQLSAFVLNETFIIKRSSLSNIKQHFEKLRAVAGVEEMKLFGGRLVASGTKESIVKLRETIANDIVVPKKASERTADECPICIDTYDEPVTLQVFVYCQLRQV